MNRADAIQYAKILKALIAYSEVKVLMSNFIPAFKNSVLKADGIHYLHGNFNLGGTVSGRLSSSNPNLQNIPSTSKYAKIIKKCFGGTHDMVMAGADFNSLEDYISALTTRDPNKLKVYLDGYDGHCLRAYYYFGDQMVGIIETAVSINTIKNKYPALRQESKGPTFALTYQGTWHTLMDLGFNRKEALKIETSYHEMYEVSDKWVQAKLLEASKNGYVTIAFGLRLRTPVLKQVVLNTSKTPYEAQKEGRTAGNALGQSYGLLNNRAANEMRDRILASPYKMDIRPISQIHDSQYYLVRKDISVVEWFNDNLIECMEWQELPELEHPTVKIGAEVDIFYPSWADAITLPNNADKHQIKELVDG